MTELYFWQGGCDRYQPVCSCLIGSQAAETASRCHGQSQDPLISVVIPTRNRAQLVVATVATVLDQRPSDIEVLVVDDGSTDSTKQELASFADQRLRVLVESQGGPCRARNAGARAARGDWLVFLDDDDHVSDDWLEVLGQAATDPDVGLAVCGFTQVDRDGEFREFAARPADSSWGDATARFVAGTFAVRREVFFDAGCYDPLMPYGENSDLGIRLMAACRAAGLRVVTDRRCPLLWGRPRPKRREAVLVAATRTLEKYPDLRDLDKKLWLSMLASAGVNSARLGRMGDARRYLLRAALVLPPSGKRWARFVVALSQRLATHVWGTQASRELQP
jgi:hypothetical protein